ncbi:MAG: hypothetical protein GEV08_25080, partial [Acidimicrobiia bacterium]|nr:hypothetical protein [Acidimicrobiia bacterium]
MRRRRTVLAAAAVATTLAATACLGGGSVGDGASGERRALEGYRLVSFDACDDLLGWVKQAALERVGPYGFEGMGVGGGVLGGARTAAEASAVGDMPAATPPTTT